MGLFVYGAILWNILISLTDYTTRNDLSYDSLDIENYKLAFEGGTPSYAFFDVGTAVDPIWNAVENTLLLMLAFSIFCLALGLLLAILVDRDIRFENTFRTIYLLPMSLSFVVTAKFWAFMYNSQDGAVNIFFDAIGIGKMEIIQNSDTFLGLEKLGIDSLMIGSVQLTDIDMSIKLTAVAFALIWQFSGYAMIVYLAGLRAIPQSHFEAARVDGASTIRMYWRVIIPQLRTATVSALVVLMVFALKAFDFLYAMYSGYDPGPSADILATRMVREAYSVGNLSLASAIAVILFAMALAVIAPYLYAQYRRGEL